MRALLLLLSLTAPALAQRPGHLGKPPPTRVRSERQVVPKWPRKPDPQPLVTSDYLDVGLQLKAGKLEVLEVKKGTFLTPRLIKRFRGRFEVRLYRAGLLLDVVRFDFPLTSGGENEKTSSGTSLGDRLGLGLAKGVTARATVRIPFNDRVGSVVVHDTLARKKVTVSLDKVRPPPPNPTVPVPGDLRTRSFVQPAQPPAGGTGKASPPAKTTRSKSGGKKLEDSKILRAVPAAKKPSKPK